MNSKEIIKHPATAASVVVTALLQFSGVVPIWDFVASTSGYWFPALATTGATILPNIGYESLGTSLLLGSALVFVAVQIDKFADRAIQFIREK